jgi:glycerol-3-phosphate O-acyltransferase
MAAWLGQRPRVRSKIAVVAVTAFAALAGSTACSSSPHADHAEELARPTADAASHDAVSRVAAAEPPNAVDLRAQLEQLLGQHAILTVRLTRARLRGDDDLAQTADEALSKNAADIAAPIGAVYGAQAAETFEQAWFNHITHLFNYARGVADDDAAVKSEARNQLDDYVTDLSEYLAEATHQAMPADVVAEELSMHVEQLLEQVDAYAAEDY